MNVSHLSCVRSIAVFLVWCWVPCYGVGQSLLYDDFLTGLDGWTTHGDVFPSAGTAALEDTGMARAVLYKEVSLQPGAYVFGFDYRPFLSATVPPGWAMDTLFVSLFLTNTPAEFNALTFSGFDSAIALLDLDAAGPRPVIGAILPGAIEPGFSRYEAGFSLISTTTLVAVFDLVDLNGVGGDSLVLIDNVSLIPEPKHAAIAVAGFVLLTVLLIRRR